MAAAQLGLTLVALVGVFYVAWCVRAVRTDVRRLRRRGASTRAEVREVQKSLDFLHVSLEVIALLLLRSGEKRGESEPAKRDG